ncbi:uncharacterized protein LOC131252189 [Magnolia sinica]|uniref:uncharacterized protein LOC131252189 n=1 Tax=Magnolia sinica TaxID=86752 RepID=UPI00265B0157|nr:uncharacterized protein LOC131252189 [Magnolia sinica]
MSEERACVDAMAERSTTKECCLCGDIGFSNSLLPCPSCGFRFQHTYCSGSYPKIDMETWRCEWCLHDEAKKGGKAFKFLVEIPESSLPEREEDQSPSNPNDEKRIRRRRESRDYDKRRGNPKRPKSFDRCRRLNCNSSSSPRVIGRRYKLLADVLC